MKYLYLLLTMLLIQSCNTDNRKLAELIVTNANIYTVNDNFDKAEAIAVSNGKILATGKTGEILKKYKSNQIIDVKGKTILPGLIDAHCHFYGLGSYMQLVDASGTKSFQEVVERIVDFQKKHHASFIFGRGWDQNDWKVQEYPTKDTLDILFPDTPVAIKRIDGHAILTNQKALDMAGINEKTKISGGEIIKKNGKLTGVLIDNAMDMLTRIIPAETKEQTVKALKDAEEYCVNLGLTTVDDAGLDKETIDLIDSLQQSGALKIRIYAMVSASKKNLDYYLKNGMFKTDRLNVRSFKFYADGALGSRGAALKKPYSDRPGHYGALVNDLKTIQETAKRIANSDFQMNTHAIGDSANYFLLKTYAEVLNKDKSRRWRIEHAQIIDDPDFDFFEYILPSIQPTHATSDMYWAEERLGKERMKGAYAYKTLLNKYGKVALGTDFPVEKVNPMLTFYAAVARKDVKGYPKEGFQMKDALNREETLKGMTIWAAYANFEEDEKGSLEPGKFADFVILDKDIMEIPIEEVPEVKVLSTYINGEKVN